MFFHAFDDQRCGTLPRITDIDSVSLLSNTSNFVISLTHDLRSLAVNIGTGSTLYSSGTFVIGVTLADTPAAGVPEPATAGLVGAALLAALCRRRGDRSASPKCA